MKPVATLCLILCSGLIAYSQTAGTPIPAPVKSKALIAAEKRIAELESQLSVNAALTDDARRTLGTVQGQLDADEIELKPLRKLMENIEGTTTPPSETETMAGNRVFLMVQPDGRILWPATGADGKMTAIYIDDPIDDTTTKQLRSLGFKSLTLTALLTDVQVDSKKQTDAYNTLVDKYNEALGLLKAANDLVGKEQVVLQQVNAYNAAAQAAAQQQRFNNALTIYSIMQHQAYVPPQLNMNVTVSDCARFPALCVH